MSYQRVWCVQVYRRQGRGIERARRDTYGRADTALARGRLEAGRALGAAVYEVELDAATKQVGRVIELARFGTVPPVLGQGHLDPIGEGV